MPLAVVRPDDWNFPLLLHVLGAMVLVGAIVTVVALLVLAWRGDAPDTARLTRLAFRTLLLVALPAWAVMRITGQWTASEEGFGDEGAEDPDWLGIGFIVGDLTLPLLIIAVVLAGLAARRSARTEGGGGSPTLARIALVLSAVLLVAYLVAVWAMTTKPS
ncbi:MAG: hypothetical protein H0U03_11070 [Actinobacteria bacterium]|nr:hypothetical protein [Actinomycetota bacterium]